MYISIRSIKIFGIWPHVRTYADRHTHASCNAVTLVWGSLRLAPINSMLKSIGGFDVCPFEGGCPLLGGSVERLHCTHAHGIYIVKCYNICMA